jgi:hypothetical protein
MKKFLLILFLVLSVLSAEKLSAQVSSVTLNAPTALTEGTVTLNAEINTAASTDVTYSFDYGTTSGLYGNTVSGSETAVDTNSPVSEGLTGLTAATQYFYQFTASSTTPVSTVSSSESSFWTYSNVTSTAVGGFQRQSATTTSITLEWTAQATDITGYLIVYTTGGTAPDETGLEQGTAPADLSYTNKVVIADASTTSTTINSLSSNSQYSFRIIPYNVGANPATTNYKLSGNTTLSTYTLEVVTSNAIADFGIATKENNNIELQWTAETTDNDGYLILWATGPTAPDPAAEIELGIAPPSQSFTNKIVRTGSSSTTQDITGLIAGTEYSFVIIPYNTGSDLSTTNYNVTTNSEVSTFTLADQPNDNPGTPTFISSTPTSITLEFAKSDGATPADGYFITYRSGTNAPGNPGAIDGTDGSSELAEADVDGTFTIFSTDATISATIPDLNPGTEYSFRLMAFSSDATNNPLSRNYKTNGITFQNNGLFTLATEPTSAVTGFEKTTATETQINFTFNEYTTFADNGGFVLYYQSGNSVPDLSNLQNGLQPSEQTDPAILSLSYTVQNTDNATSVSTSGNIDPGQEYSAILVPFNFITGNFETINYGKAAAVSLTSIWSLSTAASGGAVDDAGYTIDNATSNSLDVTYTAVTNADGYLILYSEGNSAFDISAVIDGQSPTEIDAVLPAGVTLLDNGIALTETIGVLNADTEHAFYVIPYTFTDDGGPVSQTYNYNNASPILKTGTTLCNVGPTVGSASIANDAGALATTSIKADLSNVPVDAENLVIARLSSDALVAPSDGVTYTANADFGTGAQTGAGNDVVLAGTATSVTTTSLSPYTEYAFDYYVYNPNGHCYSFVETILVTTLCEPATTTVTGTSTSGISFNEMTVNWTIQGPGNNVLVVARENTDAAVTPISNTDYAENPVFGNGATTGTGNFTVYDGNASSVTVTGLNELTDYSFDIYEYNPTGFCYNLTSVTETATTLCEPPSTSSIFNAATNLTAGSVDLNWNTATGADSYLVVAKQGATVDLAVNNGDDYTADANSSFIDAAVISNDNKIVFSGAGTSVNITGLTAATEYTFEVYAYVNGSFCYAFGPDAQTITTLAASSSNTLSLNSAALSISSVDNDQNGAYISVMDFNMADVGGDGIPSRLVSFTFGQAAGNDFADWTSIIQNARVVNVTNSNTTHATAANITATTIGITVGGSENNGSGKFGYIDDNSSVNMQLQIRLKSSIALAQIDGLNFVFELDPSTITYQGNSSTFDTSLGSEITTSTTDNEVEVIATEFEFTTDPPSTVDAGVNVTPQAVVEAQDANGNLDFDYGAFTIGNADGIPMDNLAGTLTFTNGVYQFPANFNYKGSGNGTLTLTDGSNLFNVSSIPITVNPTVSLAELTAGLNSGTLQSGTTDQAVLGFTVDALGSTQIQSIEFTSNIDLTNIVDNLRLVSSVDNTYNGTATDAVIASTPAIDNGANTITFSALTENLSTEAKNYFLILDVDNAVNEFDTPDLTIGLDIANINFNNAVNKNASNFSKTYGFEDITKPQVSLITATPTVLSGKDLGTDALEIQVTFNEKMDRSIIPNVSFPVENPTNSITGPNGNSFWSADSTIYTFYFDLTDQDEVVENIDVLISNAFDKSGNALDNFTQANLFTIDTENPIANPIVLDRSLINRTDNTLQLEVTFNKLMNTAVHPIFTFNGTTEMTDNADGAWSGGDLVYTITFDHSLTEEEINNANISISNAEDVAGNEMASTPSPNFNIDTQIPRITEIVSTSPDVKYGPGENINIRLIFDEDVTVNGFPELELNSGGTAVFQSVTNGNQVNFTYTVGGIGLGENTTDLGVNLINMNGGAVQDIAGNDADQTLPSSPNRLQDNSDIQVDTDRATVSNVTSSNTDGFYKAGDIILITIEFNEIVVVTEPPILELNSGGTANYQSGSSSEILTFSYTVDASNGSNLNDVADLNYNNLNSLILNGGTIEDEVGISATLTLPATGSANSLGGNKEITIDTDIPELIIGNPFSPANGGLNVSQQMTFTIELDEPVSGAGTNNIRIVEKSSGNILETLDGETAFTNNTSTTLSFISLENILNDSTEYYFEFDAGAIVDRAGNEFLGFTADNIWSFTSFGPARIDNFSVGACVGELFTIQGKYFTGVSRIRTNINGDTPFTISTFTVLDDENIEFTVPAGTQPGTITLDKQNGQAGNTDNAITTSIENIKVGPSSAQFILVNPGTDVVCDDPEGGSPIETALRVDVVGGTGTYTLEYNNGIENVIVTGYTSGQILNVNPPQAGINTYEIISLIDEDSDLNSCSAPDLGTTLDVEEYARSTVEAGGIFDSEVGAGLIEICLATTNEIDFSDVNIVGILPSIEGNVTTGTWVIDQGPSQNGGGFSSDGGVKTTSNIQPIYYPSLADAAEGEIALRLISDDPSAPNPCVPDEDIVLIRFVSTISVRLGEDFSICKELINDTTNIAVAQLNAALGGGADGIEWSRDDQYNEAVDHDGSWGFGDSEDDVTFTLTSTNRQAIYKASPLEVENGGAILEAIPTATDGGCGGTPAPRQLNITINDLPNPTKSQSTEIVCSGEEGIRYRMNGSVGSTFNWYFTNGLNEFDGLKNGDRILINFREVTQEIQDTLIVEEINSNGCVGQADTFLITLKPLPIAKIDYEGTTSISNTSNLIELNGLGGSDSLNLENATSENGHFSGPGVVQNSNGEYFLDSSQLGFTDVTDEEDVHEIYFTYTDIFGCSSTTSIAFNVYNADRIFPDLTDQYCVSDSAVIINVDNLVLPEGFIANDINGPGIIEKLGFTDKIVGDDTIQVFRAVFDPNTAYIENVNAENRNRISIFYSIVDPNNPDNIEVNVDAQNVNVYPLPELEIESFEDFGEEGFEFSLCTDEESLELEPVGISNNDFSFRLLNEELLPDSLLLGDSITGFVFHQRRLQNYLVNNNQDSIKIEIEYTYTNENTCSNSTIYDLIVWRKPSMPTFASENLCFVDGVLEEAQVNNFEENQEIKWYLSTDFSLEEQGTGPTFTPSADLFVGENRNQRTFYVVRRNLNSKGENLQLCESDYATVTYRRVNNPDFNWNSSVYGQEGIIFTGNPNQADIDTVEWNLRKWEDSVFNDISDMVFNQINDSTIAVNFENSGAGRYQMTFKIETTTSCVAEVTKELLVLPKTEALSTFNYDFEDERLDWVSISPSGSNEAWDFGKPSESSNIKSQSNVFITNIDGPYSSGIRSFVYSPAFDLSEVSKPVLSFDLWLDVLAGDDGLILEYSTDDKLIQDPTKRWELLGDFNGSQSSGLNWYNASTIDSNPGTNNIIGNEIVSNNSNFVGWSSRYEGEGEVPLVNATHALESINELERNNVIFRFQFRSRPNENEGFTNPDGVAFDNFKIESLNRNVLVEYFGNDILDQDQLEMNTLNNSFQQSGDFAWINYRVNENDPLYQQVSSSMLSRIYFYDAYNFENQSVIDGNLDREYKFSEGEIGEIKLDQSRLISSITTMGITARTDEENLIIDVNYTTDESTSLSDNTRLFVAVVQKEIKEGAQGTDESKSYYNVLREILPNNGGAILEDKNSDSLSFEFTAQFTSDESQLAVIAFLQDINTGEIIQSAYSDDFGTLTFENITSTEKSLNEMEFKLYPNPASTHLIINSSNLLFNDLNVKVIDLTGKIIEEIRLESGIINYELNTKNLKTGMYNLLITNEKGEHKMLKFAITN